MPAPSSMIGRHTVASMDSANNGRVDGVSNSPPRTINGFTGVGTNSSVATSAAARFYDEVFTSKVFGKVITFLLM